MNCDINEIQFPKLGWSFNIDPTAFTIFGLEIQWYGLIITLGLVLAVIYCFPRMKRFGLDSDRVVDVVLGGVIGGIIGARLYYVLLRWDDYQKDTIGETIKAMINTRNGGLAIYGGIIGAIIVGFVICKIKKVRILPMLDVLALGLLIGQGIGRWGNFVNQEAFGTNTDFFLGMTGGRIQLVINDQMQMGGDMYANGLDMMWEKPVHPCFLYESVWCLLGFVILSFVAKHRKYDGQIGLLYLLWYGSERFVVEGLRTDSLMIGSIRVSQALSAVMAVAALILLIVMFFRVKRDPESYVLYASTEESRMLIEESRRKGMKGMDDPMGDDDDEIGILPDEDDDDEIGELPDEDDEDEESEDVTEDEAEEQDSEEAVEEESEENSEEDSEEASAEESEDKPEEEETSEAESESNEEESEEAPEENNDDENASDEDAEDKKED